MTKKLTFINKHTLESTPSFEERGFPAILIDDDLLAKLLFAINLGYWKNRPIALYNSGDENEGNLKTFMSAQEQHDLEDPIFSNDYTRVFIVNNDKKEYLSLAEYAALWERDIRKVCHPLPMLLLVNKEPEEIGGKLIDHPLKGHWANDRFAIAFERLEIPANFKNITEEAMYYPLEDKYDEFQRNALSVSTRMDTEVRERVARNLKKGAKKQEVIDNLKASKSAFITFVKVNGELAERRATLEENYSLDEEQLKSKYLWFYDMDEGKAKRFIFADFVSLEIESV